MFKLQQPELSITRRGDDAAVRKNPGKADIVTGDGRERQGPKSLQNGRGTQFHCPKKKKKHCAGGGGERTMPAEEG